MASKVIKLTESDLKLIVSNILKEQQEKVYTDHDTKYDYKLSKGNWVASKKGANKWFSLQKYPTSINKLDKAYPKARKSISDKPISDKPISGKAAGKAAGKASSSNEKPTNTTVFKSREEGDEFRGWMNKYYPIVTKKLKLDITGKFDNSYIKNALNGKVKRKDGSITTFGVLYAEKHLKKTNPSLFDRLSDLISGNKEKPEEKKSELKIKDNNFILNPHIDKSMVASDTLKVNSISQSKKVENIMQYDKDDCAQFVNDFTKTRKVIGDAWLSHDIDAAGSRIHSIYTKIDSNDIKKYIELYEKVVNGENIVPDIKSFNEELLSKGPKPSGLNIDDVVGIYYPSSTNHEKAFKNAGKNYFVNGDPKQPGKTLKGGRGFSFNTHVGIVGAVKNGTPIVFHNVHGTVYSEPANMLSITWVKRT